MDKIRGKSIKGQAIYMGIDVHERNYRVSMFCKGEEFLNKDYPAEYKHIHKLVDRYKGCVIHAVYEAGAFGYSLVDKLKADSVKGIVTPPSKIPKEPGDRVKNDKRDSRKLAHLFSSGLLTSVTVPCKRIREERELLRTRDQLVNHRKNIFLQVQSKLRFHGLPIRFKGVLGKGQQKALLDCSELSSSLRLSFELLLDTYNHLTEQLKTIRVSMLALCESKRYSEPIKLLKSVPGIGLLTALSWMLELPSMSHFKSNQRLASFLGLTSSEYSSSDKIRQGRITRCGNSKIRWMLVESSWKLIAADGAMRAFYDRLKQRRGGKRAIVAVARKLSGRLRTILLRKEEYALGMV